MSIGQAADHAVQQSKLTLAGGAPFHLKAHISQCSRQRRSAEERILGRGEEFWVSPEKWRRTVQSAGFSQTLVVNGDKVSEKLTGDYYPFWLHDLVTALFDPLPMVDQLRLMQGQLEIPQDSAKSNSCVNMQFKAGIAPAQNNLGLAFCFGGKGGLLQAVITPGYKAQFDNYLPFKKKMVARTIKAEFAPGLVSPQRLPNLQNWPARMKTCSTSDRHAFQRTNEDDAGDRRHGPGLGPEYPADRVAARARRQDGRRNERVCIH